MSKSKLTTELSEQDLLSLLDDSSLKEKHVLDDPTTPSPVKFLSIFNIKPGTYRVRSVALYNFYRKWAGSNFVSQKSFTIQLKNFLEYSQGKSTFGINETALNLSQRLTPAVLGQKPPRKHTTKLLKQHVDKYIAAFELKPGDNYIDINSVHVDYWMWAAKSKKSRRITLANFINIMRLYFPILKNQHGTVMIGFENYGKKEEDEK